ncbi:MAG: hypothetical protein ACRYFA_08625 [Janthinobacterium lividum]
MTDQFSTNFLQQLCDRENEPRVIIKAVSPRFEIVAYNNWFVQISHTEGKKLTGRSMAEIQSWNKENEEGAIEIYDAITNAIRTKTIVRLPAVRYDLTMPNGTIVPSWWQAVYEPLLNTLGEVKYVLCAVQHSTVETK